MATNEKYVSFKVDGSVVQTDRDTILEFETDKGKVIKVSVAPSPTSKRAPDCIFRSALGVDAFFFIIPASPVWFDDVESDKVIAVAFSDSPRLLFPLYAAVDVRKDSRGRVVKTNHSEILYRAVDPDTGQTAKSMVVTNVTVSSTKEVAPQPA